MLQQPFYRCEMCCQVYCVCIEGPRTPERQQMIRPVEEQLLQQQHQQSKPKHFRLPLLNLTPRHATDSKHVAATHIGKLKQQKDHANSSSTATSPRNSNNVNEGPPVVLPPEAQLVPPGSSLRRVRNWDAHHPPAATSRGHHHEHRQGASPATGGGSNTARSGSNKKATTTKREPKHIQLEHKSSGRAAYVSFLEGSSDSFRWGNDFNTNSNGTATNTVTNNKKKHNKGPSHHQQQHQPHSASHGGADQGDDGTIGRLSKKKIHHSHLHSKHLKDLKLK